MGLNKENILLVDDDVHILELLQRHLQALNYHTYKAISVKEAIEILKDKSIDLLITDLKMPGVDGLELVKYVSEHYPDIPKLVVTGYPSIDGALEAMKSGVMDYLTKPFTKEELKKAVEKSLALKPKKQKQTQKETTSVAYGELIGNSEAINKVTEVIERVKNNKATVFISGESGTGKELVARSIHYMGQFARAPFIAVNCGAIPENLLEAELFGYTKGAFTGANENRNGFFQAANKGTLFLDEIGNASMATQLRLLRVLQEKEVTRVGSQKTEKVDVRVIAATNIDLKELIEKGKFREDLYYRLTVVQITVPPLRERTEDIKLLTEKFLLKYGVEYKDRLISITPEALSVLERYSWPGNIRELENVLQQAVIMCDKQVEIKDLPEHLKYQINFSENETQLPLREVEKQHILKVLAATNNNKTQAAKILQIDRKTLSEKIK
ncbi:MAG: sigma-54-dependent Fis family transcriptional regulator [Xanthomarina sp.]|jgi:DNA-binding NtrC family response regulator|uniref:sigma-54-dependent transcriptional regulator n=1 Tax=Xanthomarina TaxID=1868329 RepID=UPI000C3CD21B|nr:sigma-54 dependent transcriptional regulator [Xanthomarina sp.]MCB0389062.1 sigma-54-dependent Fis family transcriptional regulator [Winogradskyella sp.]HAB28128.1 sigma-54-dependent Fis family transcriptional regulator [Xanthomarina gelatinilytica]MAL21678.1 sigma-54-dependent Fis family transcriptional regulator [Xanthomarina sp.]MBF62918.1 sigma-54-dependent Fis family transcriptional regulator [Xanthomarina sp.]HAI19751.1 sigma-54-dependent Fis family transcriptional regulator [Xanthoma|tara:strand:+ start:1782 stop:3104 length:1323 start_codon:yes stop_codon:yes gene_type:complete